MHTFAGSGKLAGTTAPCKWYACKKEACLRGKDHPIKQVGAVVSRKCPRAAGVYLAVLALKVCSEHLYIVYLSKPERSTLSVYLCLSNLRTATLILRAAPARLHCRCSVVYCVKCGYVSSMRIPKYPCVTRLVA